MTNDHALTLGEIDVDGALQETAERAGVTRGDALRRAVLGGGALLAGSALLGGMQGTALGATTRAGRASAGDVDILNFALTLEFLEAAFYAQAVGMGKLTGEAAKFAAVVAKDEAAHVGFLKPLLVRRRLLGRHLRRLLSRGAGRRGGRLGVVGSEPGRGAEQHQSGHHRESRKSHRPLLQKPAGAGVRATAERSRASSVPKA